jgi:thiamine biosynthesis protein ThiS
MPITIRLNGENRSLDNHTSVLDLLELFELSPQRVIVERNRQIVDRDSIDQVTLEDGDDIEIIRLVSGG